MDQVPLPLVFYHHIAMCPPKASSVGSNWGRPQGRDQAPSRSDWEAGFIQMPYTGLIHVYSAGGLNNILLSQGCTLEAAPGIGGVDRMHIPRTERKVKSL